MCEAGGTRTASARARRVPQSSGASPAQPPIPIECERLLVERARTEPAAFAELYDRHVGRLYAYALRCLGDRMAAEDIVAETFQRAIEYLPRYQWRGVPFRAWLYRIASNAIAGCARRTPMIPIEEAPDIADDAPGPEDVALRRERRQTVLAAIATLPLSQRQVVLLRYAEDLPHRDIAHAIGRSEGAVKVLLHRAQRTLYKQLAAGSPGQELRAASPRGAS